jgi:TPR repeat protein
MKKNLQIFLAAAFLSVAVAAYAHEEPPPNNNSLSTATAQERLLKLAHNSLFGLNGHEINYEQTIAICRSLIEEGNDMAFYMLGIMYLTGKGVAQNDSLAMQYFLGAVERGNGYAAKKIAWLNMRNGHWASYEDWQKLARQAVRWLVKAVEFGYAEGYYSLGYAYFHGSGVEQDYKKAIEYFEPAAAAGHLNSSYMLGFCYINGYGVERNPDKCKVWMQSAADKGHPASINFLDRMKKTDNHARMMINTDENYNQKIQFPNELDRRTPRQFKQFSNNVQKSGSTNATCADVNTISGNWSGKLITYDWSGKNIIDEQKIELYLYESSGKLYGSWNDGQNNIDIYAALSDTLWVFTSAKKGREQEELTLGRRSIALKFATFNYECNEEGEFLSGNLWRYRYQQMSFMPPSVMVLMKNTVPSAISGKEEENKQEINFVEEILDSQSLIVYPNPFSDLLNLSFTLNKPVELTVTVYSQIGSIAYSRTKKYVQGNHAESLWFAAQPGIYTLRISGAGVDYSTQIIKH